MERFTRKNELEVNELVLKNKCEDFEFKNHSWSIYSKPNGTQIVRGDAIDKFSELEDSEEKGLFLRLPCKVGDTVYCTEFMKDMGVISGNVLSVSLDTKLWISVRYKNGLLYHHPEETIGKTVFLTREEAEAALKKIKDGK